MGKRAAVQGRPFALVHLYASEPLKFSLFYHEIHVFFMVLIHSNKLLVFYKGAHAKMSSRILRSGLRRHATFPHYGRPAGLGECAVDYKVPFSRKVKLAPSVNAAITSTNDIRAEFLSFFRDKNHTLVAPSSVYPKRQEGSYFINAGEYDLSPSDRICIHQAWSNVPTAPAPCRL